MTPLQQRLILPHSEKRDRKSIVHRVRFNSLSQCVAWAGDLDQPRWSTYKASQDVDKDRTRFSGAKSFEAAAKLATRGWKEGRSKLVKGVEALALKKELVDVPSFVYDVAGARPEVPLAVAGDPCCMWDANPLQEAKAPVLRFIVETCASCQWEADDLIRWGTAILSVIDSLEANGTCTVELSTAITITSFCGSRREEFIVKLKEAGQHIDFDVMAFAIAHPAMLRRIGFGCCERIVEDDMEDNMTGAYGRPGQLSADALDGAYYVPSLNFADVNGSYVRSDFHQVALFESVMRGFRRLVDGQPFSCKES